MDPEALRAAFASLYGATRSEPVRVFSAPGRVNLIGEHTDYNDGFVLPLAIERRTAVAAARRGDRVVRVHSRNLGQGREFLLDRPGPRRRGDWLDYVEGTAWALGQRGIELVGADLLLESGIPSGAGLSSSAALEISVGFALASLSSSAPRPPRAPGSASPSLVELALAGQEAEHVYVGTMCGIMDQLIVALGKPEHALLIDCRSLETTAVPLDRPGAVLLVCDTKTKHELASSEYNRRRAECEEGVRRLAEVMPGIEALRDVTAAAYEAHADRLPEPVRRRCRHVVTENERTLAAARALERGDLNEVGRLMVASHESLRDDYEVSCPELDASVEVAMAVPGVFGARMTGGGFGGCTVSLVASDAVGPVSDALTKELERRFGVRPALFATRASRGVMEHD